MSTAERAGVNAALALAARHGTAQAIDFGSNLSELHLMVGPPDRRILLMLS